MKNNVPKYLKTTDYAKMIGCSQRTVHRNFHLGCIKGYQDPATKTIYIENPEYISASAH